ncbi:Metabotropic glutamate receptor 3 [Araneus ventricosus]|uniref:Metabotropic glutamate receptor 3 n=1 Tax=Araneus ventricosus TaxID=182803 RepID=A0A4Y2C9D4_ARAVE|nr:Metabotropic glutamate receptor 3 [Araneus ventricosus]
MVFKNVMMSTSQLITFFLVHLLANGVISLISEQPESSWNEVEDPNQIILGGLFPVHAEGRGEDERCGPMMLEKGIQRLEAMLYAIDQINNNPKYWKFKMQAVIFDTCSSESYALEQALQFLTSSCGQAANISSKVTAIVGASNSIVSQSVTNIFRLLKIPQVSYASTSEELDDLYKYPYFFRVVPSDRFQLEVILDIIQHFKWTYVSLIVSEGEYGEKRAQAIQTKIRSSAHYDICFAAVETLPRNATKATYNKVVSKLDRFENVKGVIVFLNEEEISELLDACERYEIPPGRFVWVGSSDWGAKERIVRGHEKMAVGSITISPKRFPIEGFDEYFKSLKPDHNARNPWFKEFWENQFNCVFRKNTGALRKQKSCTGREDLGEFYRQESLVPMVIDSVHLLATAIKTMCEKIPRFCSEPEQMEQKYREEFLRIIKKTSFYSPQGHGMVISFDNARSVPAQYSIYEYANGSEDTLQIQRMEGYGYRITGEWNPTIRLSLLRRPEWDRNGGVDSRCSEECPDGEQRISNSKYEMRCCWTCRPCDSGYYLPDPTMPCQKCPEETEPSSDKKTCIKIEYFGPDFTSAWALVPLVFSIMGIISTSAVLVIFFLNRKTPIIMASGLELCYFIVIGIILCYCYSFVALLEPTEASCGALQIGMGLGPSICYSAIFTKTNRLSRIFEASLEMMRKPSYISPKSQIMICICLVLIHVTFTVLWLIIMPPDAPKPSIEGEEKWVTCELDGISLLVGLGYNMFLLILCTIYAYKTRNIPDNFNETKWISFAMYASCIMWLVFIPIYCGAVTDYKVRSTILSVSVSASGTIILACMIFPKIYIAIFHPEGSSDNEQIVRYLRGFSKTQDELQQPSPIFNKPGSSSPFPLRRNPVMQVTQ